MQCPVCQIEINFQLSVLEEMYYDCSQCHSSLLFKNGKCEIINKNEWNKKNTEQHKNLKSETGFNQEVQGENIEAGSDQEVQDENIEAGAQQGLQIEGLNQNMQDESFTEYSSTKVDEIAATVVPDIGDELEESTSEPHTKIVDESSELHAESVDVSSKTPLPVEEEIPDESSYVFSEEAPVSQELQTSQESAKEDFSEVVEFAESQDQDQKGLYLYDLTLSEINSQNTKEEVIAVLEDQALNINLEEDSSYIKDIKFNGKLSLSKISPVHVYVIVHALMNAALKIHWKQYHIADSENS